MQWIDGHVKRSVLATRKLNHDHARAVELDGLKVIAKGRSRVGRIPRELECFGVGFGM